MEPLQNKIISVGQLVDITFKKMQELNYSSASLKKTAYSFKVFKAYAEANGVELYTEKLTFAFLEEYCKIFSQADKISNGCKERKRAVEKLYEMYKYNTISSRKLFSQKSYIFKGCLKNSIDSYLDYREKTLSIARIKSIKLYLERFSEYISKIPSIKQETDLKTKHILGFIESSTIYTHSTLYATVTCVRSYVEFLEKNNLLQETLSYCFPKISKTRNRTFPNAYTKDETNALLESIGTNNSKERRDYAMILLAARVGLRSSDIANLKFNNLDWENNQIRLVQQKTKTPLTLPLLKDVGEALINYIKNGRPNVENQHIFIRENPPYVEITATSLYTIVDGYLKRAKIKIPAGKKHGPHALRHSIATLLLENNIPISTIKEILSHKSTQTTKIYLKIAEKQLLECALEVPILCKTYTSCTRVANV